MRAALGSFTPGPNNMIAAAIGANHGFRVVLPHMLGVVFGFTTMLVAGSFGLAALIAATPWMAALLKWGGIAYLMAIAWQIAGTSAIAEGSITQPLTFWQSAVFQYANPKAWTIGMATLGTFASGGDIAVGTAVICTVFAIIAFVSVGIWGGSPARRSAMSWLSAVGYACSTLLWVRCSPARRCGWRCGDDT